MSQPQDEDAQRENSHDDGEKQVWNTLVHEDAEQRQQDAQEARTPPSTRNNEFSAAFGFVDGG